MNFEISNLTKSGSPVSELLFCTIKEKILGKKYSLSLTLVGDSRAKKLNQTYRNKNYIPNTLSFPIDENVGEIILNLRQIEKDKKKFEMSFVQITILMFIHSCLHLKGYRHGQEMKEKEELYLNKFLKLT